MRKPQPMDRRTALSLIGSAGLAGFAVSSSNAVAQQQEAATPPDQPHELKPDGADMGTLFPDMERLVARNQYPYSFLTGRFRSVEAYRKAGREVVLDALGYKPAPVPFAAEVVDRQDMGEFVREKVLFSTSSDFRVPAYVRSEEHTSELQSRQYLVCRLLLEKKTK